MSRLNRLAALAGELEELRVAARGQATRIRLDALREAATVSERISELATAPEGGSERVLAAVEAAIARLGGEQVPDPEDDEAAAAASKPPEAPEAGRNGASGEDQIALDRAGRISVDVGPFSDFYELVGFEDAANAIGATGEIAIRRFSEGRANIEVDLNEPVDLLRELEQRCDLELRVRARSDDEIILDLDG